MSEVIGSFWVLYGMAIFVIVKKKKLLQEKYGEYIRKKNETEDRNPSKR